MGDEAFRGGKKQRQEGAGRFRCGVAVMDDESDRHARERLVQKRMELRNRLATAWERREPLDVIRRIEKELAKIWHSLDTAEALSS